MGKATESALLSLWQNRFRNCLEEALEGSARAPKMGLNGDRFGVTFGSWGLGTNSENPLEFWRPPGRPKDPPRTLQGGCLSPISDDFGYFGLLFGKGGSRWDCAELLRCPLEGRSAPNSVHSDRNRGPLLEPRCQFWDTSGPIWDPKWSQAPPLGQI